MPRLTITLFGGFQAELDGKPLSAFGTDKNRALLAYLALESKRPHRREALANLFWCERTEREARNNLRQALYSLRHLIDGSPDSKPHLLIYANEVRFNSASDCWIDVVEFQDLITTYSSNHTAGASLSPACLETLQCAIELYRGDLLSGFTLRRCLEFTNWRTISQEVYHRKALAALTALANHYEANREYGSLIESAQLEINLEPWRESAHRRKMWALAMAGQREQALRQYDVLRYILMHEFGTLPVQETRRLYEQLLSGGFFHGNN